MMQIIVVSAAIVLVVLVVFFVILWRYKRRLNLRDKAYRESFYVLKISLNFRHQVLKRILAVSKNQKEEATQLLQACDEAANKLLDASRSFSEESLRQLCRAEADLTVAWDGFCEHLNTFPENQNNPDLMKQLEMLAAADEDVRTLRRAYNRSAERYNHLVKSSPFKAGVLGCKSSAGLARFQTNRIASDGRVVA